MTIIVPNGVSPPAGTLVERTSTWTFVAGTTGAVAAHTVFTITGRVEVDLITAFCTDTLTSAGTPAITLGSASDLDGFILAPTGGAPGIVTNDWWLTAVTPQLVGGPTEVVTGGTLTSARRKVLAEDIVLDIPVSTVTGGTLVFYVRYRTLSSGAGLAVTTPA